LREKESLENRGASQQPANVIIFLSPPMLLGKLIDIVFISDQVLFIRQKRNWKETGIVNALLSQWGFSCKIV
jgi:hypothetical protein